MRSACFCSVLVIFVIGTQFPIFESDCSTLLLPLIFSSLCFLVCSTVGRCFLAWTDPHLIFAFIFCAFLSSVFR